VTLAAMALSAHGAHCAQRADRVHDALTQVRRRHAGHVMKFVYPRPGLHSHTGM